MLEDKTNKDEIKASLEKLCSLLPSSVESQCDTFVETYTDLIIDMLTKDVSPEMICTNLGLCKSSGNIVQHKVDMVRMQKKPYCALCEMVITQLDQMLEDKTNEAEIEQALDIVCTSLSAPVRKQCEKLVVKYTEKIISLFVAEYTPEMLCGELSLCVNDDINTNNIHQIDFDSNEVTAQDQIGCEICEFAMTIVDQHLTNPSTIDEVERMVQFLCSYLPGTIADKCEEFVDQWGQTVIDMIVQDELNPSEVCGQIMPECSSQPRLGGRNCAWGPAYWCATPFHARACGTTTLCQNTVWKKRIIE
jgi:saposin